jgi:predicted metalloprotease with PDZ domain
LIFRSLIPGAGGILLAGLLVSTAVAGPRMEVEVEVEDLASGELIVSMELDGFGDSPLALRDIPSWVDNPFAEPRGEVVRWLRVEAGGELVSPKEKAGDQGESFWVLPTGEDIELSYRLHVDFQPGEVASNYQILIPYMDDDRAWLLGNHVFMTPVVEGDEIDALLAEVEVDLSFDLPDSLALVGPPRDTEFDSLFELLSLQFGIGDFDVFRAPVPGWDGYVAFESKTDFSREERERLIDALEDFARRGRKLFGGVPADSITMLALRENGIGGLEGSWAFHAFVIEDVDLADERDELAGIFCSVIAHELVHAWLPIALFPRDDPWVKEGFTSFYGYALAARGGWIGPATVDRLFAKYDEAVFGDVELEEIELSDSRLWYEEYSGESWRRVSYDRGFAVSLLLDVHLRTETGNRKSLDDVMPVLFERHRHRGFDRDEFIGAIEDATGVDVREFFSRWVDSTNVPEPRAVDDALRQAIEFGAFARD